VGIVDVPFCQEFEGRRSSTSQGPTSDRRQVELDACIGELQRARTRSEDLLEQRQSGRPWIEIVSSETRPLVVESISTVLGSLATAGHAWRREQASALQGEQVSINRIAALFGVTRQRISALLRERDEQSPAG
jgi:hypothetical protein